MERALQWAGCLNARNLGGLATADGRRIRPGALIRSDSPHWLTESGVAHARSLGVRRILDLRSTEEAEVDPSPFAGDPAYRLVPLIDASREPRAQPNGVAFTGPDLRRQPGAQRPPVRRRGGRDRRRARRGDPVHCQEGKDRTGVVIALALLVAGVEPDLIAADYALSAGCLQSRDDAAIAARTDEPGRGAAAPAADGPGHDAEFHPRRGRAVRRRGGVPDRAWAEPGSGGPAAGATARLAVSRRVLRFS